MTVVEQQRKDKQFHKMLANVKRKQEERQAERKASKKYKK